MEALTATRISILHASRYKEEREQIGTMRSAFTQSLVEAETRCLVQLSEASRKTDHPQIALNSIVRAQCLSGIPRFDVSHEYPHVLWLAKEPRPAVQALQSLVAAMNAGEHDKETLDASTKASLYSLLVRLSSSVQTCRI